MKIKYECEFCRDLFDDSKECAIHESEDCPENPAVRGCETCQHQTSFCGSSANYYGCEEGVIETSPRAYAKNCASWELRGQD